MDPTPAYYRINNLLHTALYSSTGSSIGKEESRDRRTRLVAVTACQHKPPYVELYTVLHILVPKFLNRGF